MNSQFICDVCVFSRVTKRQHHSIEFSFVYSGSSGNLTTPLVIGRFMGYIFNRDSSVTSRHRWCRLLCWWHINYFLNMTWKTPFYPWSQFPLSSHCAPGSDARGQEVELWKVKELRTHSVWSDGQQEGNPLGCYWNYSGLFFFLSEVVLGGTISHL